MKEIQSNTMGSAARDMCIEERDENDSSELRARYVYGGLYVDEPVRMYRDTNDDGDFADAGDYNVYYLQDRLFNVAALTDTDGTLKERTWYECYGKPTNRRESDVHEQTGSHYANEVFCAGDVVEDIAPAMGEDKKKENSWCITGDNRVYY